MLYININVERALRKLLDAPGFEGIDASAFIERAVLDAERKRVEQTTGVSLSTDALTEIEIVLDLARGDAQTTDEWFAIQHVAEMVGLEDASDDLSIQNSF
jgi:hypothetical protein